MNKMFESESSYKSFIATINCLTEDALPFVLNREDPMELSLFDIKDFIERFKKDTELDVTVQLYMCDECGQLHMTIVIDEKESEEQFGKLHLVQ